MADELKQLPDKIEMPSELISRISQYLLMRPAGEVLPLILAIHKEVDQVLNAKKKEE